MEFKTRPGLLRWSILNQPQCKEDNMFDQAHDEGVNKVFDECEKRVKFYNENCHPNTNVSYLEDVKVSEYKEYIEENNLIHDPFTYNTWLFKYCFKDMII